MHRGYAAVTRFLYCVLKALDAEVVGTECDLHLSLNAAGAVAARESLYLFTGNEVEVAGDCVL